MPGSTPPSLGTCWQLGWVPGSERASSPLPGHQATRTASSGPSCSSLPAELASPSSQAPPSGPRKNRPLALLTSALPLSFPRAGTVGGAPSFCRAHPMWPCRAGGEGRPRWLPMNSEAKGKGRETELLREPTTLPRFHGRKIQRMKPPSCFPPDISTAFKPPPKTWGAGAFYPPPPPPRPQLGVQTSGCSTAMEKPRMRA